MWRLHPSSVLEYLNSGDASLEDIQQALQYEMPFRIHALIGLERKCTQKRPAISPELLSIVCGLTHDNEREVTGMRVADYAICCLLTIGTPEALACAHKAIAEMKAEAPNFFERCNEAW
jgi:hypothetical protein